MLLYISNADCLHICQRRNYAVTTGCPIEPAHFVMMPKLLETTKEKQKNRMVADGMVAVVEIKEDAIP